MSNRRRGYFAYNGKLQSITNILKGPGVPEFLQRNGPMKDGPLRNKLRRLLKVGGITKDVVDTYLRDAVRNNRDPYIILPRQRGSVRVNGEQMTARQALARFPLLGDYLQRKRPLNERALHAKCYASFVRIKSPGILRTNNRHTLICTGIISEVPGSVINSTISV